jgi:hypothetical protein
MDATVPLLLLVLTETTLQAMITILTGLYRPDFPRAPCSACRVSSLVYFSVLKIEAICPSEISGFSRIHGVTIQRNVFIIIIAVRI